MRAAVRSIGAVKVVRAGGIIFSVRVFLVVFTQSWLRNNIDKKKFISKTNKIKNYKTQHC